MTMPQVFGDVSTQQVISDASRPGPPGANAYDVAVANGFTGTQQEWLQSLVGPPVPLIMQGDVAAPSNVPAASTLRVQDSGKAWTVTSTGNAHIWDGYKFVIVRFRGTDGDLTKALGDAYYSKLGHTHPVSDITNLQSSLDSYSKLGHTHSVSDVAGLQTSLDAKVSASNLQNAVKGVDGAGSGIDADLLDGKESTEFATSGHVHKLNDVWKNAAVLASGADLNAIGSGVYQLSGTSVINGPSVSPKGPLISVFLNGVGTQEIVLIDGVKWTRGTADGVTWTSWMRPATDAKPPAIARAMTANQSISSDAFTKILFDRSVYTTGSINYANGDFTVTESGLYSVNVLMMIGHTAGGGTWKGGQLEVNGNILVDIGFDATAVAMIAFSRDVNMDAGDVLKIYALQYSGANVPVYSRSNGSGTQVSMRRVSARVS